VDVFDASLSHEIHGRTRLSAEAARGVGIRSEIGAALCVAQASLNRYVGRAANTAAAHTRGGTA
jgi:hypothetical protein